MTDRALRRPVRIRKDRSGQALVEFALTLPILLLLILGLVDFAQAWSAHHVIADAAREGARMLVVHDYDDPGVGIFEAETAIEDRLTAAGLSLDNTTIVFHPAGGEAERGQPMTVTIDYLYDFWIVGIFMDWATGDQQINLVSTITMRSE